jgi:radical SAM protein with 4Fe4S-binding SPASM domain
MTGGEVFVREDCFDLIEGVLDLGLFVSIESNGTLLDREQIGRLAEYGNNIRLSISLDGFSPESNDQIRGFGSFDKIMAVLQRISATEIPARVITVLHEGNLHEIPEMASFVADSLGMGYRLIPSIMEYGRGVYACSQIGAKWHQINSVLEGFFYDFLRERRDERHSVELNMALVPIDVKYHHICSWGSAMIGIGPDGSVGLCHVGINDERFVFGDLTKQTLESVWNGNSSLEAYRAINGQDLKGICGNCLAKDVCRGGCRVHAVSKYGEMFAPSPQCQAVYELGDFPEYAMEDSELDCSYSGGT